MQSVKLGITCRTALERKYDAKALRKVDAAIAKWIAADAARGIRTIHLALDDAAAMKPYHVPAIPGTPTAAQVKRALDALVARLSPDYIVIVGSGDVIPFFEVANPTESDDPNGDTDPTVPTDNPYASSQPFNARKRASYLVPDRVVGRIPDLPGSGDPSWLVRYLAAATTWSSRPATRYRKDLMVCCDEWRESGRECIGEGGAHGSFGFRHRLLDDGLDPLDGRHTPEGILCGSWPHPCSNARDGAG